MVLVGSTNISSCITYDATECGVEMSRLSRLFVDCGFLGRTDASDPCNLTYGEMTEYRGGYEYG